MNKTNKQEIAKRLKELRTYKNLSQERFGNIVGVSQDNVSLWENGKSLPTTEQIVRIVQSFPDDTSADYLLGLKDF